MESVILLQIRNIKEIGTGLQCKKVYSDGRESTGKGK